MSAPLTISMHEHSANEVFEWIHEQDHKRETERYRPYRLIGPATSTPEDVVAAPLIVPELSALRVGRSAHMLLLEYAYMQRWLAIDYCDGRGPRARFGRFIAEPTDELPSHLVELS